MMHYIRFDYYSVGICSNRIDHLSSPQHEAIAPQEFSGTVFETNIKSEFVTIHLVVSILIDEYL